MSGEGEKLVRLDGSEVSQLHLEAIRAEARRLAETVVTEEWASVSGALDKEAVTSCASCATPNCSCHGCGAGAGRQTRDD